MRIRKPTAVALIVALTVSAWVPPSRAIEFGKARSDDYLSPCADLVDRVRRGKLEETFVGNAASSPEKMLRLMFDYSLVFSQLSRDALLRVVDQDIHKLDTADQKWKEGFRFKELKEKAPEFLGKLLEAADNPDRLQVLSDQYLNFFLELTAVASGNGESELIADEIRYLQTTRLLKAIDSHPEGKVLFAKILKDYIRDAFRATAMDFLEEIKRSYLGEGRGDWWGIRLFYLILVASIGVTNFAIWDGDASFATHVIQSGSATIISGALGFIGAYFLAVALSKGIDRWRLRSIKPPEPIGITLHPEGAQWPIPVSSSSLTQPQGTLNTGLSLEELCQSSPTICNLSVVQLTYGGHFDLLKLKRIHLELKELVEKSYDERLQALRSSAQVVVGSPDDLRAKLELGKLMDDFLKLIGPTSRRAVELIGIFEATVTHLVENLKALGVLPFQSKAEAMSETEVAKYQLIWIKIQTEFPSFTSGQVSLGPLAERARRIQSNLEKLNTVYSQFAESLRKGEGWSEFARELLAVLDEIEFSSRSPGAAAQ